MNLQYCLKKLKNTLEFNSNFKVFENYFDESFCLNNSLTKQIIVIQIKNINDLQINLKLNVFTPQILGYKNCLNAIEQISTKLNSIEKYKAFDVKFLAIEFNKTYQTFYQEISFSLKKIQTNNLFTLTFGKLKFNLNPNSTFKIERQLTSLGSTIDGSQFVEFNKPIKQINGSFNFDEKIFNELFKYLQLQETNLTKFQGHQFYATISLLSLNLNNSANFQLIEDITEKNEF